MLPEAAARHQLRVDLHGETLAGQLQPLDEVAHGDIVRDLDRISVEDNLHLGLLLRCVLVGGRILLHRSCQGAFTGGHRMGKASVRQDDSKVSVIPRRFPDRGCSRRHKAQRAHQSWFLLRRPEKLKAPFSCSGSRSGGTWPRNPSPAGTAWPRSCGRSPGRSR